MPNREDLAAVPSAAALAADIKRKGISPVEVMDAAIARIEAHNPKINAVVIFGFEEARKAAKAAEAAIMRGDRLGPLHGVPIAMKDCFDFKPGWVTTFGGIDRKSTRLNSSHSQISYAVFCLKKKKKKTKIKQKTKKHYKNTNKKH